MGIDLHKWLFLLVTGQGEYAENFPYHGCALPTELGEQVTVSAVRRGIFLAYCAENSPEHQARISIQRRA
jgi:hypothetical protein